MKKITILGYYAKSNLGDDLFNVAFQAIADAHPDKISVRFIEPTEHNVTLEDDCDALVVGGGDIVTSYFETTTHRLKKEFEDRTGKRLPTYATSIGLSFPENINDTRSSFLDLFDHITFRSKTDADLLMDRYPETRVRYLPDLVFTIPRLLGFTTTSFHEKSGILLVCLAQAVCADNKNPKYSSLVDKLTDVLEQASQTWNVAFMNFNTNKNKITECDDRLHTEIQQRLSRKTVVIEETDPKKVWGLFRVVDRVFAMRFHAHVLAISTGTPLVSLSMTNKTENLMVESGLESCLVRMVKPDQKTHYPVDFDAVRIVDLLKQDDLPSPSPPDVPDPLEYFTPVLEGVVSKQPPDYLHTSRVLKDNERVMVALSSTICKFLDVPFDSDYHPAELRRLRTLGRFYYRVSGGQSPDKSDDRLRNTLVALIELVLTGSDVTDFKYGLTEQLWSLELNDGVEWILHKLAMTEGLGSGNVTAIPASVTLSTKLQEPSSEVVETLKEFVFSPLKMNMEYIPQQVAKGYHRSGWKYVVDGLREVYNDPTADLIFDGYLDKTFHWSRDVSVELGLIPYKKSWIGFLHHTPDQEYTPYNTLKLVNDPLFRESLGNCRGILVMSEYLRNWLLEQDLGDVPVFCLTHPTMFVEKQFDLTRFFTSQPKWRIVQVGGWLRDPYGIYALEANETLVKKCALKGKGMENYYPLANRPLRGVLQETLPSEKGSVVYELPCGSVPCDVYEEDTIFGNKYYKGMLRYLQENESSVEILERLSDEDYDELLSGSVVFLKLADASACNTVIECIVRNTPILVNRLPALVEVLGEDYPLFYHNLSEAAFLASDAKAIVLAHLYLRRLDKTPFMLEQFLEDMGEILENLSY